MAKNINHVSHKKSKQKVNGMPQLPSADVIVEGEIAVNFGKGVETLSIKNESGDVVTFSSDHFYTEQKLGSAFTGENSAKTVTDIIEDNELVTATALNDLKENKLDVSAYTEPTEYWVSGTGENAVVLKNSSGIASGNFSVAEGRQSSATSLGSHAEGSYTVANNQSEHASGQYNVSNSASTEFGHSGNTLFSVGNGTAIDARHNAFEIRQNGDIYIVNKDGNDVKLQDEIGNITVDQVLDGTTSASTNPVSSKAVYSALTADELVWTNAYVTMSGAVSSHTSNATIHLTSADRDKLNSITGNLGTMAYENKTSYSSATQVNTALADKASTGDIANFFDNAKYEDSGNTKVINFYHGDTIKATIDADDFIKDGMISGVTLEEKSGTTYLVIEWNTDAGIQTTELNIGDLFEADNYYTKSQTSGATELSTAFDAKLDKTAFDTKIGSAFTGANSGVTITEYIEENELITSTALNDLKANKLDASAYTPTDLSNYYTKSETSGKTEISNALAAKTDNTAFTAHTADTSLHFSGNEKANLDSLATNIAAISGITSTKVSNWDTAYTSAHTHSNKSTLDAITASSTAINSLTGAVGTMAFQNTNSYSSATEVNTALELKLDKTDFNDKLGSGFTGANSGNTVTSVIQSNERVTASALNDLQTNKLDASAYTPTDLSNYYTKSETSGATELSTVFGTGFTVSSITEVIKEDERVTSEALNDLNTRIGTGFSDSSVTVVMESKASQSDLTAVSGVVSSHTTAINDLSGQSETVAAALVDLNTNKLDATAYTPTDLSNYYTKSETSGASQISTALNGKSNTGHTHDDRYYTESEINALVGSGYTNTTITEVIENMDNAIAAAITDLNDKIGDIESILATI